MLKIGNNSKIKETAELGETQVTRFFFLHKNILKTISKFRRSVQ